MALRIQYMNLISNRIKKYQEQHGSTKTWIANKAGLSRQTLSSLEDTDNPNIQSLIRLAYALDCKITDLYDVIYIDIPDDLYDVK